MLPKFVLIRVKTIAKIAKRFHWNQVNEIPVKIKYRGNLIFALDIESVLASSKDYDELSYVWSEWRKVAAKPMRSAYENYVNLSNLAAQANDLNDMSELWVEPYETEDFPGQLEKILNETRPLYEQIHAFTRMKLRVRYGQTKIDSDTPIPASLLGNQSISNKISYNPHVRTYLQETCGPKTGATCTVY